MQNNYINTVFLIFITLTVNSCDYHDGRLNVINQTGKTIVFEYDNDSVLDIPSINKKEFFIRERLEPGETNKVLQEGSVNQWPFYVTENPDSTLWIYIYDYDLVLKNNWDSLRANKLYDKRLSYSIDELNSIDWKIEIE